MIQHLCLIRFIFVDWELAQILMWTCGLPEPDSHSAAHAAFIPLLNTLPQHGGSTSNM